MTKPTTLILIASDSGAGHIKQERLADRILTFLHPLTTGPVPAAPPERFFADRKAMYVADGLFYEDWWFEAEDLTGENPRFKRIWSRLPEVCREYDRVIFWMDPDANAQLLFIQLLDWLGQIPEIAPRLWLKQLENPSGARRANDLILPPSPIGPTEIALASRAWAAFCAPTPEPWAALLDDPELRCLPGLARAIAQMLGELPDATGLGATERRVLNAVDYSRWDDAGRFDARHLAVDDKKRLPRALIGRALEHGECLPFGYWEIGTILCDFAAATTPALAGISEVQYSLAMHLDEARFAAFRASVVSLTELGIRLRDGTDDWARHNPVHRWWGGTRLTNDTLWRWDRKSRRLFAPGERI